MKIEITVFIALFSSLIGVAGTLMTLLNHYKKEIKEETVDRTNVLGDISYIRGALDNTCQEIKEIGKEARELRDRIIRVEKMIEFAHEKIDERQA